MSQASIVSTSAGQFAIKGTLSFATVTALYDDLDAMPESGTRWVIDLSQIKFADSAGVAYLVALVRFASERQIAVTFHQMPKSVEQIVRMCGLEQVLGMKV